MKIRYFNAQFTPNTQSQLHAYYTRGINNSDVFERIFDEYRLTQEGL
jgi:hypothetical protein